MACFLGLLFLWATSPVADRPLKVIASIPDLGAMAEAIGGDAVDVEVLVKPGSDPHRVLAKASMVLDLSRADLLLTMGLDYEHAFLPAALEKCRNPKIQPGAAHHLDVGLLIAPLEVPDSLDRSHGADVHPRGNPHFNLDPENGRIMARAVCEALMRADPDRASLYESRWRAWDERAERLLAVWAKRMAPLRGREVVVYHRSWSYLAARYGLVVAGEVEPKPGMAPGAGHLARLSRLMQERGIDRVLLEPWYPERVLAGLLKNSGAKTIRLHTTCGATPETTGYLDWMDSLLSKLASELIRDPGDGR